MPFGASLPQWLQHAVFDVLRAVDQGEVTELAPAAQGADDRQKPRLFQVQNLEAARVVFQAFEHGFIGCSGITGGRRFQKWPALPLPLLQGPVVQRNVTRP